MSVVVSLLRAIDHANGEALVMHVGEKPYVVTAAGHAELAAKALTIPAMTGMLDQLLPPDSRHALDEFGAVEYHLPPQQNAPGVRYSVVAARGGNDIWIELRRRKDDAAPHVPPVPQAHVAPEPEPELQPEPEPQPEQLTEPRIAPAIEERIALAEPEQYVLETLGPVALEEPEPIAVAEPEAVVVSLPELEPTREPEPMLLVEPEPLVIAGPEPVTIEEPEPAMLAEPEPGRLVEPEPPMLAQPEPAMLVEPERAAPIQPEPVALMEPDPTVVAEPAPAMLAEPEPTIVAEAEPTITAEPGQTTIAEPEPEPPGIEHTMAAAEEPAPLVAQQPAPAPHIESPPAPEEDEPQPARQTPHLAAVVPMTRAARHEPAPRPPSRAEALLHLLQFAAGQGASVLYVSAQAKPSLRVDGEIRVLDHETPLTEAQLEAGLLGILPRGSKIAVGDMQTSDVPEVGRVQVLSFRDHRGLGAMFRMLPARAISSEQTGLGASIQALCTETEGLLLVAGARGSGKSTLTAALVDQINRTRRDHVITVEQQIQFVHENRQSFVSQREARDDDAFAAAVRSALREGPDVLVVDQMVSTEAATFALHAASNGHLVIAALTAPSTSAALGRFVEFFGEDRAQARATLSEHLRGVVTQTLLRKTGGGRAAAREVLVNVPSVAALIADGAFDQLGSVLNGGRRVGMVPLNDALLGLVQSGALDVREAYRKSPDQQELVMLLNRAGLDTTFAERLA